VSPEWQVDTAERMQAVGRRLAGLTRPGDLLVLAGPLGAGKTVLVQGLAAGLGVRAAVTSPTFVLARTYRGGRLPLVHVDAYRLGSVAEIDDLDLEVEDAVTAVEWGEGLAEGLAAEHLLIRIERAAEDDRRTVRLTPSGPSWAGRLQAAKVRSAGGP
jgi:tRNA threonylcarbamoyladenosine biosynthesis protein TsaE